VPPGVLTGRLLVRSIHRTLHRIFAPNPLLKTRLESEPTAAGPLMDIPTRAEEVAAMHLASMTHYVQVRQRVESLCLLWAPCTVSWG
jgi:hypothetical protein